MPDHRVSRCEFVARHIPLACRSTAQHFLRRCAHFSHFIPAHGDRQRAPGKLHTVLLLNGRRLAVDIFPLSVEFLCHNHG